MTLVLSKKLCFIPLWVQESKVNPKPTSERSCIVKSKQENLQILQQPKQCFPNKSKQKLKLSKKLNQVKNISAIKICASEFRVPAQCPPPISLPLPKQCFIQLYDNVVFASQRQQYQDLIRVIPTLELTKIFYFHNRTFIHLCSNVVLESQQHILQDSIHVNLILVLTKIFYFYFHSQSSASFTSVATWYKRLSNIRQVRIPSQSFNS